MVTKATNSVLNLVSPPIDNMVLLQGTLDNVVIGSNVPNTGRFTSITDTSLASALVGAPSGTLVGVSIGTGLQVVGNVLSLAPAVGITLFVRTDGSDANDGSQNDPAHAFATLEGAFTYLSIHFIATTTNPIVIILGNAGLYSTLTLIIPPGGNYIIEGLTASPSSYVLSGGSIHGKDVLVCSGSTVFLSNLTINNTNNYQNWVSAVGGGQLFLENVIFSASVTDNAFACIDAFPGGSIFVQNIEVTCNAAICFNAHGGGNINISGDNASVITFAGGPSFGVATVVAADLGYIVLGIVTMNGLVGGTRYVAESNSVINAEGQGINIIAGNSPGFVTSGGIYEP